MVELDFVNPWEIVRLVRSNVFSSLQVQ
jgi:hypothetical protein